jgi:hypothetical protein
MRAIEGADLYNPIRVARMCLVPNMMVLKEFRVLKFIKYTDNQCPTTYLKVYYNKMVEVVSDEKLLIHFFQGNLSGTALVWYMRLDSTKIRRWKDLVEAFMKQYNLNIDITLNRSTFFILEKGCKESVYEYA